MLRNIFALLLLISFVINILGQSKLGSCPNERSINVCAYTCLEDNHCRDDFKCCRTACGSSICIPPVPVTSPVSYTPPPRRPPIQGGNAGKAGACPAVPTGPWVCTSTCDSDDHCPGSRKCCKNRCGALVCTKPNQA